MKWYITLFIFPYILIHVSAEQKTPKEFNQTEPSAKFDNPNFVRDRYKNEINRPDMPTDWGERFKNGFNPAWMDYCDPYHCNDYHKVACGLNRKSMKFKWFQSVCHIILNNKCAGYRGTLKYDIVDPKYCHIYVMYLRTHLRCPVSCRPGGPPICTLARKGSTLDVTLFVDRCAFEERLCSPSNELGCLLLSTANAYVLFAANLEDFKNLAERLIPKDLADRLSEMVSESSLQYKREKQKMSDSEEEPKKGKGIGRHGKRAQKSDIKNDKMESLSTKLELGELDRSAEKLETQPTFYTIDDDDKSWQFSTMEASKDRRYKTVKRMPSTKRWLDQSPAYLPSTDYSAATTERSLYKKDVRTDTKPASALYDFGRIDADATTYTKDSGEEPTPTPSILIIDREIDETYDTRPKKEYLEVEFEHEDPKTTGQLRINGRVQKKLKKKIKSSDGMIFDRIVLNKNKGSYEELPERDEVYFSEEAIKPKPSQATNLPKFDKKIARQDVNKRDIFESEETQTYKKPKVETVKETTPTTNEQYLEDDVPTKPEAVKAITENLLFNSKEENSIHAKPFVIKSTGVPTRERYKMSSPDYYKKLPRIVEKYDFNEPLPDKDREPEKIDDRFAQDPVRINKNVHALHQKKLNAQVSRQFKAILDELQSLNRSRL